MKRKLALLLVATMLVGSIGLTACGQKDKVAKTKELSVQIGPNPETMDPALNSAVDAANMILYTNECLLTVDKDNKVVPGQAESYEVSKDGLTWTFHLRDGLKWSDGSKLTASDFVYSWKRVCDPKVAAPYAETVLSMVKGFDKAVAGDASALAVSAPDDRTFVVQLAENCPYFDSLAAFVTLSPVQKATIEKNGDAWSTKAESYIGNGAFLISEWVPDSHITMKKNPNYWNAGAIKLDSIKFLLMEDPNAAYSAYQSGEVQMIKDVPTEEIPSLKGNSEFHIDPILGTYYISLNNTVAPFNNKAIREALSLAIDRKYVAETLMQGIYTPATNLIGPGWADANGGSFYNKANGGKPYIDSSAYEANLAQAKKILADAGFANGQGIPTLTYTTNNAGYHKVVAEYLQQAWGKLGIKINVEIVEWASFTPMRRSGQFQIARNGWVGDYNDVSNLLGIFVSNNGNNDGKYKSAEFDAAMKEAAAATDATKRLAALHKAEDTIMKDAGCIPLAYYNDFYLQSSKVTGSWHSPYGYWYFMYADIAE